MQKMPTTSELLKASPRMKPVMVLDAYTFMGEQFELMQRNMKVLTAWVDCMPSLIEVGKSHVVDMEKFLEAQKQFEASRDALTAQFVDYDTRIKAFAKFLKQNQFV